MFTEEEINFAKKTEINLKRFGKTYTTNTISLKEIQKESIVDFRNLEELNEYYYEGSFDERTTKEVNQDYKFICKE